MNGLSNVLPRFNLASESSENVARDQVRLMCSFASVFV